MRVSKFKRNFFLMAIVAMMGLAASAAEIFVSNAIELKEALKTVKAGDVIIWKDGKYQDVKIDFRPAVSGTAQKPIILRAQTPGKVSFSGGSQLLIGGNYLQAEGFLFEGICTLENGKNVIDFKSSSFANHCRVTNCAIVNYSLTEESGKDNYYVNLVGTYNEVDHCYFTGKSNKGPTLVVEYLQGVGYISGSDVAPSTHHRIHHNYFGYRTFSSNGGEQMRIGTSTTSFSHGFNIIEYNYIEDERLEAEAISSKSWDNIYRFNTFIANDGGMVIRHGQQCFVYGNYMNGKTGRNESAGLRVINPNNTVFNNYLENLEGGDKGMKAPITIMSGLEGSAVSGYFPADNAIVAYNTVVNSVGPAIKLGIGNVNKGKALVAPKNVLLVGNTIINTSGKNTQPLVIVDSLSTYTLKNNRYNNGNTELKGFSQFNKEEIITKGGFSYVAQKVDKAVIAAINKRLKVQGIQLTEKEITHFDPKKIVGKKEVGVSWIK